MGRLSSSDNKDSAVLAMPLYPGCRMLRRAIRRNIVSFPSQVPVFLKANAGIQWRVVLLFFVLGWSSTTIAARFNVPVHRVWQIVEDWSVRAFGLGYLQIVDAVAFEGLAACAKEGRATRPKEKKVYHVAA